jgi:hypothetical protein
MRRSKKTGGSLKSAPPLAAHLATSSVLQGLAIFALAVAVRLPNIDHAPLFDELYHVLAAQSWVSDGTLAIGTGTYTRSAPFTVLTAWMFSLFGETLPVARIAPIIAGSLSVVALFLWLKWVADSRAAWVGAILLCFSPLSIVLSDFIRFYTLHGLLFFLGAIGIYALVVKTYSMPAKLAIAVGALVSFVVAFDLQVTTMIGLASLALWLSIKSNTLLPKGWRARLVTWRVLATLALLAAVLILIAVYSGLALEMIKGYRSVAPWYSGGSFLSYHWLFSKQYPTFWSLLPLIVVVAVMHRPDPAIFCASISLAALGIHSFAGMRGERYIFYVIPFLFGLWAVAVSLGIVYARNATVQAIGILWGNNYPRLLGRVVELSVLVFLVLFVVASNPGLSSRAYKAIKSRDHHPAYFTRWDAASSILRPMASQVEIVLTSNGLKSEYYLGRYDIEINRSHLLETTGKEEFAIDQRTGTPVVSTSESFEKILSCHHSGLIVTDKWRWRNEVTGISDEMADAIVQHTTRVKLPDEWNVLAFRWDHVQSVVSCPAEGE